MSDLRLSGIVQLLLSRGQDDPDGAEIRYYLRVTVIVLITMVVGAALTWLPPEPSPWRWLPLGVAYLVGGSRIARDSWATLRDEHKLSIDFLMGTAALGAAIVGSPLEGVILIFLFSLSNTLEHFAMGRTRHALARLRDLSPREATLVDGEGVEVGKIPVGNLRPGQAIVIKPGERIAADGRVRTGRSEIDQSAITGESMPVSKSDGDDVYAGTINQSGMLIVEVTREAGQTMLAKIIQLVEEAREQRAPAQNFIDRFAHPYTLIVLAATLLTATVPALLQGVDWNESLYRAMTLLVVASPCALVISTPSAILSGIANGARHGILFKGGAYLDLAGTIDTIAFDKTGTLTVGRPRVQEVVSVREAVDALRPRHDAPVGDGAHEDYVVAIAAAVERSSEHHLARAKRVLIMRNLLVLGALAAATAAPAIAQEVTISGNVALTTDYMWRNVSQTGMDWAIQGGFDLETESGFYAGTWASSLSDAGPSIELDLYAGYAFEAGGVGFDIGYIYYAYPDEDVADLDFYEIYAGVSKEFDAVGLGAMLSYDPDNETTYLDLSGSYAINDAFGLSAGYGAYLEGVGEYSGWNVGASWAVGGVDLGVTYYDNDMGGDNDNFLFSIGKSL